LGLTVRRETNSFQPTLRTCEERNAPGSLLSAPVVDALVLPVVGALAFGPEPGLPATSKPPAGGSSEAPLNHRGVNNDLAATFLLGNTPQSEAGKPSQPTAGEIQPSSTPKDSDPAPIPDPLAKDPFQSIDAQGEQKPSKPTSPSDQPDGSTSHAGGGKSGGGGGGSNGPADPTGGLPHGGPASNQAEMTALLSGGGSSGSQGKPGSVSGPSIASVSSGPAVKPPAPPKPHKHGKPGNDPFAPTPKHGKHGKPGNDFLSATQGKQHTPPALLLPGQHKNSRPHESPATGLTNQTGKEHPAVTPATQQAPTTASTSSTNSASQSGPLLHIASLEPTSVSLTTSADPITVGQPVTFTAEVSSEYPGTETGVVIFYDGNTQLGSVEVSADSGGAVATLTTSSLSAGSHSITADYQGDDTFAGSDSSPLTQLVRNTSSVSIRSSANPILASQSVTFTATVTGAGGTPTGPVQFQDGGVNLGGPVNLSNGTASLLVTTLMAGTHNITAAYQGDMNYAGSTSSNLVETVQTGASTTVTVSPNPSV
jgi:hypothetical protein